MKIYRYIIFAVCVSELIIMSGCNEPQTPSEKQSRLIAAENMELQKELKQRDEAIEILKAQYSKKLVEQEKLLVKAQDVLDTVIKENSELRREIEKLKKHIETQQSEISRLEKMLAEKTK